MPSSPTSWPTYSTSRDTRMPTVRSMAFQTMREAMNVNAATDATPNSWTPKSAPAAMLAASVPQTPATRCTGMAPTTSSSFSRSISLVAREQSRPPMAPMMTAHQLSAILGAAVIDTNPARAPLRLEARPNRPKSGRATITAASSPLAAARLVLAKTLLITTASTGVARANCEPPLNPNQPSHRIKTPRVTTSTLEGGVAFTLPSGRNLPRRGPTTSRAASAADPPVTCTTVEPAKSWKSLSASQPPPHTQAPAIG